MNTTDAIQKLSEEIFEVVKEKIDAKVDKADIGYFEIDATQIQTDPPTITLTQSQMLEINKKYCIVKILGTNAEPILYKSTRVVDDSTPIIYFHTLSAFREEQNIVSLDIIEMQVNVNTSVATFYELTEEHYSKAGSDNKFQTLSNLRTSFQSTPSDTNYPSEKLVKDNLDSINAKIPSEASSSNKLADKSWTNTQLGTKQPTIDSSHKLSSDLVDDANSNNKFVTATEKENISKALYNLGAFDSVSGNTITRQTGYYTLTGNENWVSRGSGTNCDYYYSDISDLRNATRDGFDSRYIACNIATAGDSYSGNMPYLIGIDNIRLYITVEIGANPNTVYNNNTYIQYKLLTAYTEDVIPEATLLPLDSNMANKIRQKVVDGLNLFNTPNKNTTTEGGITYTISEGIIYINGTVNISSYPQLFGNGIEFFLKAGTYTISKSVNHQNIYMWVDGETSNSIVNTNDISATFTLTNDMTVLINLVATSGGVFNNFKFSLMISESSHLYPHSNFNQKEHITNDEATLLKQEEEKCSNLFDVETVSIGDLGDTSQRVRALITVGYFPAGFTFSYNIGGSYLASVVLTSQPMPTNSSNLLQVIYNGITFGNKSGTYTLSQAGYLGFVFANESNTASAINLATLKSTLKLMLNKGSEAKPYQEWNGEIVHKKDIEPVLLWENPSPTSTMSAQTISNVKDMSNYKYIIFKVKRLENSNSYKYYKIPYAVNNQIDSAFIVSAKYLYTREYVIASATSITVEDGYYGDISNGSSISLDRCSILVAIYGTNVL